MISSNETEEGYVLWQSTSSMNHRRRMISSMKQRRGMSSVNEWIDIPQYRGYM
jgi:hypothetical protein